MSSEKKVKDFMHPLNEYGYVKDDDPVVKAVHRIIKAMRDGKPPCLVVIQDESSEKEVIKGFVTPAELVFGLSSHFLKGARSSGPIFWEGQFESECREGIHQKIGDIMTPIHTCVRDAEMIMEAIFLFNKFQVDFLPVIHRDDVVGIIHIEDILEEIGHVVKSGD